MKLWITCGDEACGLMCKIINFSDTQLLLWMLKIGVLFRRHGIVLPHLGDLGIK